MDDVGLYSCWSTDQKRRVHWIDSTGTYFNNFAAAVRFRTERQLQTKQDFFGEPEQQDKCLILISTELLLVRR